MLRTLTLCTAICLFTSMTFAQGPAEPGAEHALLKEVVGEWDAVMHMGDQQSKATATYRSICNGMWLESDFKGEIGGTKFEGHGVDGYNQITKKYTGVWFDSMSSGAMHFEGDYDAKTKTMTMTGESVGPDGSPQKFKTTTVSKDKDHFTFKMFMVPAAGDEQLMFTIEYTRRK